jgi:hypothetical protein
MFQDIPSGNPSAHPCLDKWLGWTDGAEQRGYFTPDEIQQAFSWSTCAVGFNPTPGGRLANLGAHFAHHVRKNNFARCREIISEIRAEL